MKKRNIKLFDPKIDFNEKRNIKLVFDSHNWASGSGSNVVNSFEKKFVKYTGARSGIAVNSGTAALHLAVSNISKVKGEVIVPSLSFVSTAHCVLYSGHKVIFSDVDPLTGCIDPVDIEKKISKKTKAIIPVHFGGLVCDLKKISNIAKSHNIHVIEDASHAAGATYHKKRIGSHSDFVCFSFHPVKNLAMPSGGFITINSKNSEYLTNTIKSKRWCGISNRIGTDYDVKELLSDKIRDEKIELNNKDYSDQNLVGENFFADHIKDTDFSNANLVGADFSFAKLDNVNFTNADLTGADFSSATIINSDFTGADLTNIYAATVRIQNSFFHNTNLSGAFLVGAEILCGVIQEYDSQRLLEMTSKYECINNAIFENANLSQTRLFNLDFYNSKVENTKFIMASVIKSIFPQEINADFSGSTLPATQFHGDLSNVIFSCHEFWCSNFSTVVFGKQVKFPYLIDFAAS